MNNQECELYGFQEHNLTNEQYYEQFDKNTYVGEYIGITRQHYVLMENMTQETFCLTFYDLSSDQQQEARNDTEERYLSYIFAQKSGNQYNE